MLKTNKEKIANTIIQTERTTQTHIGEGGWDLKSLRN